MGRGTLTLDNILSAVSFFVGQLTPDLKRNQSRDLLRFLICKLYDQSRGQLHKSQIKLAQTTLAQKLGLSRQWVGTLLARLQHEGWLEFYAPKLETGIRGSTIFRIGRQLKRVLLKLIKSKPKKNEVNLPANERWQFSPSKEEKKILLILKKESTPPHPDILHRLPLLKTWLNRGGEKPQ
jgi:hypothetical protein